MIEVSFDIKPYDIQGNLIWNNLIGTWIKVNPQLTDLLKERLAVLDNLKEVLSRRKKESIQGFTFEFMDEVDANLYDLLLLLLAQLNRALDKFGNEFCIAHKGYSLN